ncbi:hypothetical protein N9K82_05280 [Gammaproteobacteria bacterium]|nr:hypothetical protein [Gammaproteobacteria bacterium]
MNNKKKDNDDYLIVPAWCFFIGLIIWDAEWELKVLIMGIVLFFGASMNTLLKKLDSIELRLALIDKWNEGLWRALDKETQERQLKENEEIKQDENFMSGMREKLTKEASYLSGELLAILVPFLILSLLIGLLYLSEHWSDFI